MNTNTLYLGRDWTVEHDRTVREILAGHPQLSFGRGPYRPDQAVGVAGVAVEYLLRILLILEVLAA